MNFGVILVFIREENQIERVYFIEARKETEIE